MDTVVPHRRFGSLQIATPTLFCSGQLMQTESLVIVSAPQLEPLQQVWAKEELKAVLSEVASAKKFTGHVATGKLKASRFDESEPGGASFQSKGPLRVEGRQAPRLFSSGVLLGSG